MAYPSTALSVNLNKVALVRNTRHLGIPSVTRAATLCLNAGAHGITVHPRPDERHIRAGDVHDLAVLMQAWPDREFNIEGNPFQNLMGFVRELRQQSLPLHQCTFVPDSEGSPPSLARARWAPIVLSFIPNLTPPPGVRHGRQTNCHVSPTRHAPRRRLALVSMRVMTSIATT